MAVKLTRTGAETEREGLSLVQYRGSGDVWVWGVRSAPESHWVQKVPGSRWWTTHVDRKPIDRKSTTFENAVKALAKALKTRGVGSSDTIEIPAQEAAP